MQRPQTTEQSTQARLEAFAVNAFTKLFSGYHPRHLWAKNLRFRDLFSSHHQGEKSHVAPKRRCGPTCTRKESLGLQTLVSAAAQWTPAVVTNVSRYWQVLMLRDCRITRICTLGLQQEGGGARQSLGTRQKGTVFYRAQEVPRSTKTHGQHTSHMVQLMLHVPSVKTPKPCRSFGWVAYRKSCSATTGCPHHVR